MKTRYLLLLVIAGHAIMSTTASGKPKTTKVSEEKCKVYTGLSFTKADPKLKLDLFIPENVTKPMPCIVVIQGGGFKPQNGQRFRHFAEYFADNGFAAALISYRGRPRHHYHETVADAKAAVRFVRSNSKEYGIDPNRIGAMGISAGATLVALLAVSHDVKGLDADEPEGISSQIQAGAAVAGVYDFIARFTDKEQRALQPKIDDKIKSNGDWIGAPFSPTDEQWQRISAINHVDAKDAPMLLLHSKDDPVVPWIQSRDMCEKLKKAGVAAGLELSNTGKHAGPKNKKELMLAFFRKVLGNPATKPDGKQP